MSLYPPKRQGILFGLALLGFLILGLSTGIGQLATGLITPLLGLWTALVIICIPLLLIVIYRLYGLINATYVLNRDGFFLRWGLASDEIPLEKIRDIVPLNKISAGLRPKPGFWWPGCVIGSRAIENLGLFEFFSSAPSSRSVVISLENRNLVISPPNMDDFIQTFHDVVRLGSLEEIPEKTARPNFFSAQLWSDILARVLIIFGLITFLSLLAYISIQMGALPDVVPFGFDADGNPDPLVPAARLIILPLVGGFFWVIDLIMGAWLFRNKNNRPVAYIIWGLSIVVGGLLWGAVLQLMQAA
ncbi:MAG: hypothetical protein IIC78_06735 [Chloroflexi bacterium]|nr:hypothetical protein [Chloroflexota bacterium]